MLENKTIDQYLKEYSVEWASEMPQGCPPRDILVPHSHPFFRYAIQRDTYNKEDFKSYLENNPQKDWGDMPPLAAGLSILDNEQKARKNMKLPMLRHYQGIISLTLNPTDGVVKQTGVHKSHYTWWRTKSFNMNNLIMLEL